MSENEDVLGDNLSVIEYDSRDDAVSLNDSFVVESPNDVTFNSGSSTPEFKHVPENNIIPGNIDLSEGCITPGRNARYPSGRWWIGTTYTDIHEDFKDDDFKVLVYFKSIRSALRARAIIGQIEKCPETGRLHGQYVVRFESMIRLSGLKKRRPLDHFERVRNRDAAIKYCSKVETRFSNTFVRDGDIPLPNTKELSTKIDWEDILLSAQQGTYEKIPARIYVQYYSSLTKIHEKCQQRVKVTDTIKGFWHFGKPGIGKTRFIFSEYDNPVEQAGHEFSTLYLKSLDKWWDGFKNKVHSVVFMDEVSPTHKAHLSDSIKVWSDAMSFQADVKGSKMVPVYDSFVIASNYTIEEFSGADEELKKALERRFTFVNWNDKNCIQVYLPFPVFDEDLEIIERIDVTQYMKTLRDLNNAYQNYAKKSCALGFNRPMDMTYNGKTSKGVNVQFKFSLNCAIVFADNWNVSMDFETEAETKLE